MTEGEQQERRVTNTEAPPTDAQKKWLIDHGVDPNAVNDPRITRGEASSWIDSVKKSLELKTAPPNAPPSQKTLPAEGEPGFTPADKLPPSAPAPAPIVPAAAAGPPVPERRFGNLTAEQVRLLKSTGRFPQDASPDEVAFGLSVAASLHLDPKRKQIRFLRFRPDEPIEPFVAIDGLQAIAARTGGWAGIDLPKLEFANPTDQQPVSASVTVYRMIGGQRCAFSSIVWWTEAARHRRDGQLNRPWAEMPRLMLGKVARAAALRMAFPEELSGVYSEEEAPGGD
jgi:phage recombination protein Bet